ncbi:protein SOB FIVE-LIKE 5-like [Mangifera indica]|uniref:protein SOB FIVE-LIKE 5-like n=1 Tax=Mangifera indica TaxID=29780 RepID=UPI001CF9D024|nr:protein SOB FIVE-LIKE 5-like [Mangifera indica]
MYTMPRCLAREEVLAFSSVFSLLHAPTIIPLQPIRVFFFIVNSLSSELLSLCKIINKMNFFGSECSSVSESGWTLYLEQSNFTSHRNTNKFVDGEAGFCEERFQHFDDGDDDKDEDLSMVSDASSGPPTFHEDEDRCNDVDRCNQLQYPPPSKATREANSSGKIRLKKKEKRSRGQKQEPLPSFLDDTASSPVINFSSKNNFGAINNNQASMESVLDYSQGYSATHFQRRSAFQDPFSFLQSSHSGNHVQNNQWL